MLFLIGINLSVKAQAYVSLTVSSGFNQDLIAENSPAQTYTSTSFDGGNAVYYSDAYPSRPCPGLPSSGTITSETSSPVFYQLASYSSNNCLLLTPTNTSGTLTFSNPGAFNYVSICAVSAVSAELTVTFSAQLNFAGGSSTTYYFTANDWFVPGYQNWCISGRGRVDRYGSFNGACAFYIYDCKITMSSADQLKTLNSILFTKTDDTEQKCAIFAVSGANVPPPVVATAGTSVTSTGFDANWVATSANPSVDGYYLDVSTSSSFGSFVTDYNNKSVGTGTTSSVTGLSPSTTYYYRLRAHNTAGTGPNSNVIAVTTLSCSPPTVTATAATSLTSRSFQANWDNPGGACPVIKYWLDVSTDPAFGSFLTGYQNKDMGTSLNQSVSGLTPGFGPTYYYRVRGQNSAGVGSNSNRIDVNLPYNPAVAPVVKPYYSTSCGTCYACWWPSGGSYPATSYLLDVATDSGFTTFVGSYHNFDVGNVTTYLVTGLTPGVTYFYRVRGVNADGISPFYSATFSFVM